MKRNLLAYVVTLLVFLLLDGLWLGVMMGPTYGALLGPLMRDQPLWGPAVAFYLMYVLGVVVLVVRPALAHRSGWHAAGLGALLGLVAYGTYDLSNWATLHAWPGQLAVLDMAWGTVLTCLAASAGYAVARRVSA